jgi:hypothetical protein
MTKKKEDAAPAPEEQKTPPELSMFDKVKLMADIANASQDAELSKKIKSLSSGDRIYEIFVEAINRELLNIMNGKKEDPPQQVANLTIQLDQMSQMVYKMQSMIGNMMHAPLMYTLDQLVSKLGGQKFEFSQPQEAKPQVRVPVQMEQSPSPSPRGSTPGLGSF